MIPMTVTSWTVTLSYGCGHSYTFTPGESLPHECKICSDRARERERDRERDDILLREGERRVRAEPILRQALYDIKDEADRVDGGPYGSNFERIWEIAVKALEGKA